MNPDDVTIREVDPDSLYDNKILIGIEVEGNSDESAAAEPVAIDVTLEDYDGDVDTTRDLTNTIVDSQVYAEGPELVRVYCAYSAIKHISGICQSTGLVERERRLALGGNMDTLYAPLYLRIRANPGILIHPIAPFPAERDTRVVLLVRMNGLAIIQPIFMPVKVEMGIMIRRAANRAFGVSNEERTLAHECAASCIKDGNWTPQSMLVYGEEVPGIAEALIEKVRAVVLIQDDRGKVWRNRATVDEIKRGALEIAAMLVGSLRKSPRAM